MHQGTETAFIATPGGGDGPHDLTIHVAQVSRGNEADASEGMPAVGAAGRGLLLSVGWEVRPGMMVGLEREYDARGELAEVRSKTAVRGGWVGGPM